MAMRIRLPLLHLWPDECFGDFRDAVHEVAEEDEQEDKEPGGNSRDDIDLVLKLHCSLQGAALDGTRQKGTRMTETSSYFRQRTTIGDRRIILMMMKERTGLSAAR